MSTEPVMYRKKPCAVMAYLWDGSAFAPSHVPPGKIHDIYSAVENKVAGVIETLEGPLLIVAGEHYVVGPGAEGEFWPVKKSIFEATYERA